MADPRAFRVPLSREEWEQETRALLDEGQWFLAYDLARTGLERHPDSTHLAHFLARALTRTGALEEARRILEPLCAEYRPDPESLRSLHHALQQAMTLRIPEDQPVSDSAVATLGQLLAELSRAISAAPRTTAATAETWGLLGRVYKDIWRETGRREDAVRSRDIYLRGFDLTGDHFPGINAATMSWLIGEKGTAMELAERVLKACSLLRDEPRRMLRKVENLSYWLAATEGEAQLLIAEGQADTARGRAAPRQALRSYRRAARLAGRNHAFVDSTLQQLRLLAAEGFPVPPSLFRLFKPAVVVAFSGHMIDRPGRTPPRFPPALEGPVRSEIERVIEQLDARVGFCSAACGADLLFIEAMLARGAEVNVVLPFELQSFVETSVEHAGARWVARLHNALALVKTLKYVSEEPYLGDDELFAFANRIFLGMAELRAGSLAVRPHLVALLDGEADRVSGGTADVVAGWGDASRLRTIRLDVLRAANPAGAQVSNYVAPRVPEQEGPPPQRPSYVQRRIQTMLFADIVGYSKLPPADVPLYVYRFLAMVADRIGDAPRFVNTWGDAVFAVMDEAVPMVKYAMAFQEVVCDTDWTREGFSGELNVRIALHAGPVFSGVDPITCRQNFYGSQVNRAARIEPVTVPGHIYASEQFVAMLVVEEASADQDPVAPRDWACEWLGTLALAKEFGPQTIYHIRRGRC